MLYCTSSYNLDSVPLTILVIKHQSESLSKCTIDLQQLQSRCRDTTYLVFVCTVELVFVCICDNTRPGFFRWQPAVIMLLFCFFLLPVHSGSVLILLLWWCFGTDNSAENKLLYIWGRLRSFSVGCHRFFVSFTLLLLLLSFAVRNLYYHLKTKVELS